MAPPTCGQCGQPLPEQAKFCGQCGAVTGEKASARGGARTLLQVAPPAVPAGPRAPDPPAPSPGGAPRPPAPPAHKQTMMGLAAPELLAARAADRPAKSPIAGDGARTAAPAPGGAGSLHKTMLGIPAPSPAGPTETAPRRMAPPPGGVHRTMLGVAMPGIAPTGEVAPPAAPPLSPGQASSPAQLPPSPRPDQGTLALNVPYVPPPAPLRELPAPVPPRIVKRTGGLPLAVVALVVGGLVLVGGVAVALLWKSAPPIAALPRSTPDGKDILSLRCDPKSCADGTVVSLDGARATFAGGATDLPLARPLHVGANPLALLIDRPGMGRDETVKLTVPVGYRVRTDVGTMTGPRPCITIRIEALPGTEVRIDGKPAAIDAAGNATFAVDEGAATEGPADESRVVAVDVPYVVVPPGGAPETGTASARVVVAPLRIDSPGARAVVEESSVVLAGRAARGSTVTVDGATVSVGPEGSFETTVALGSVGEHTIEVRVTTPALMPRTIHVTIVRVARLAEAARQFERQNPIGYDAAMTDIAGKTGRPIVVHGRVLETRTSGHGALVLVDDARGCARGPCIARVVVGRDLPLVRGDWMNAYGTVARAFTTSAGQTVPEIDAQFVLRSTR